MFSNLSAGEYVVEVMDANGCSSEYPVTLANQLIEDAPLQWEVTAKSSACGVKEGSIMIETEGGTQNFEFYLNGAASDIPGFSNLVPGIYQVGIRDLGSCFFEEKEVEVALENEQPLILPNQRQQNLCLGESVQIRETDGIVQWSLNGTVIEETDQSFYPPETGIYYLSMRYSEECVYTDSVSINVNKTPEISLHF